MKEGNLFEEIIAEDFLNLGKEIGIQTQETQRSSKKINPKRSEPKHTIIKMAKSSDKEKILKQQEKRKQLHPRETPYIRLSADFSAETL